MSKATAMSLLSGIPVDQVTATQSLVTPEVDPGGKKQDGQVVPQTGTEAVKPEPAKIDELESSRLAIYAKKEAALQIQREAFKKEKEEWEKNDKSRADAILAKGKQFDETFSKDKLGALRLLGYSDTDIINILSGMEEKKEAAAALSAEDVERIAEEKAQKIRDEFKQKEEKTQAEQNDRLVSNLKTSIKETIKSQAEKYEYCSVEEDAEAQAFEIIVEELKETSGQHLLSVAEALDIAEEYYEALDKHRGEIKKRQPAAAVAPPAPEKEATRPTGAPTRVKTLTNNLSATTAAATVPQNETRSEKKERLAKLLLSLGKAA
jgi:hypothetical protein